MVAEVKRVTCLVCHRRPRDDTELARHVLDTHIKPVTCRRCEFACRDVAELKNHHFLRHEIKPRRCLICGFLARSFSRLRSHITRRHIEQRRESAAGKMYECAECMFRTNNGQSLNYHRLRIHEKKFDDAFHCPRQGCQFVTYYPTNIPKHMRTLHRDVTDYYNCTKCNFVTVHKCSLKEHLLKRHEKNDHPPINFDHKGGYRCEFCPLVTNTTRMGLSHHVWTEHLKQSRDSDTFSCPQCQFVTKHKDGLRKHFRSHHTLCKVVLPGY